MKLKFKDDLPRTVSLGIRKIPADAIEVHHPDGTPIYLVPQQHSAAATELIIMQSKFDKSKKSAKYLEYGYTEHILDTEDANMFQLMMFEFSDWHTKLFLGR